MRFSKNNLLATGVALAITSWAGAVFAQATAEVETQGKRASRDEMLKRITYGIKYMASDEMGGRQPGTPGIKLCEEYIVDEYKKAGLQPLEDGTYFQELEVDGKRGVDKENTALSLKGPDGKSESIELGKGYQQLMGRQGFDFSGDLVFVGYGISAEDDYNFDEYAKVDVKDKI